MRISHKQNLYNIIYSFCLELCLFKPKNREYRDYGHSYSFSTVSYTVDIFYRDMCRLFSILYYIYNIHRSRVYISNCSMIY